MGAETSRRAQMVLCPVKRRGRGRKGESRGARYSSQEAPKRELVTKWLNYIGKVISGKGQPIP